MPEEHDQKKVFAAIDLVRSEPENLTPQEWQAVAEQLPAMLETVRYRKGELDGPSTGLVQALVGARVYAAAAGVELDDIPESLVMKSLSDVEENIHYHEDTPFRRARNMFGTAGVSGATTLILGAFFDPQFSHLPGVVKALVIAASVAVPSAVGYALGRREQQKVRENPEFNAYEKELHRTRDRMQEFLREKAEAREMERVVVEENAKVDQEVQRQQQQAERVGAAFERRLRLSEALLRGGAEPVPIPPEEEAELKARLQELETGAEATAMPATQASGPRVVVKGTPQDSPLRDAASNPVETWQEEAVREEDASRKGR